jgi:hypothetical protein
MRQMLSHIDNEEIKKDKDLQILKGIYKIPDSIGDVLNQNKIK